jgi:aminoglycoside 3-N-acetyltransferase
VVPTFSPRTFLIAPPDGMRVPQGAGRIYTPDTNEVEPTTGALAAAVLARPERARGNHPLWSFAAVGPLAERLIGAQRPLDVYAPLRILAAKDGFALLIGADLTALTLIHLAEEKAGGNLLRRWANGPDGRPMEVEVGGCPDRFEAFAPVLAPVLREATVGRSRWRAYPAREALERAVPAIRAEPRITHCGAADCRCDDAVAGGPAT